MDIQPQSRLQFMGVDITNVQFQTQAPYTGEQEISIAVEVKVYYPKESPGLFNIIMTVGLQCQDTFTLTVASIGNFSLDTTLDQPQRDAFVSVNAPAIMFPYLRSFITTLTANMGSVTSALIIPPHFFQGPLTEIGSE